MNSPESRSSWLMTVLTDTDTPGTTACTWALTSAVSCSRSPRRNGRTSTEDMSEPPPRARGAGGATGAARRRHYQGGHRRGGSEAQTKPAEVGWVRGWRGGG